MSVCVCAKTLDPKGDLYYFIQEFNEQTLKDPKGDAYYVAQGS